MRNTCIPASDTSGNESKRVTVRLEVITLVHENLQVSQGKRIQQAGSKLLRPWMFDGECGAEG